MRARVLLISSSVLVVVLAIPILPARAATSPLSAPPATYGDERIVSAQVPSFDGSPLDVDVTLPMAGSGSTHPLVVFLHGLGNTKHEWESLTDAGDNADKWHWNTHWFAEHGYYALTYTARGFNDSGPTAAYQPATPSFSSLSLPYGTAHVKSREVEVRDTEWLAAQTAAAFPDLDPNRVAVTGGSYGGGESWLLASQAAWTFPHSLDATLPVLQLQVAVPKYPWTDVGYSLAPSGHGGGPLGTDLYSSSTGAPDSDTGSGGPLGVAKESYITGLFALAEEKGQLEDGTTTPSNGEGPVSIASWYDRAVVQGDPYDAAGAEDPLVAQIRRGLTEYRSAYYQDEGWLAQAHAREVAVFSIQGWSDDLFTAVESFREFKYLKALDHYWPVAVAVADVGHSRAQNKPDTWHRLNAQAWQFVQAQIPGSHRQQTTVYSEPTICAATGQTNLTAAQQLTATTPEGLSAGTLTVHYASAGQTTNDSGLADQNDIATDPVFGSTIENAIGTPQGTCRTAVGPATGAYTAESSPLPVSRLEVGLGYVDLPYQLGGGPTATVEVRVWDEVPNGPTVLVTRGAYRIDAPAYDSLAGTIRIPLFGNEWQWFPGHRVRLDVTQSDSPTFRASTLPSALSFGPPTLVLPTRDASALTLAGS